MKGQRSSYEDFQNEAPHPTWSQAHFDSMREFLQWLDFRKHIRPLQIQEQVILLMCNYPLSYASMCGQGQKAHKALMYQ